MDCSVPCSSQSPSTPSSSVEVPLGRVTVQPVPQVPTAIRILYPFLIFLSIVTPSESSGRCFNTQKGLSIDGSNYRRIRNVDHRACALECRDDSSCLAYEWIESDEVCFLKSKSLNGTLRKKEETIIGFCLDEDDEVRDRFRDHIISGPVVVKKNDVIGDECRDICMEVPTAAIYTWTPTDQEDDEAETGACECLESLRGMQLQYNSYSGFLGPRRSARHLRTLPITIDV